MGFAVPSVQVFGDLGSFLTLGLDSTISPFLLLKKYFVSFSITSTPLQRLRINIQFSLRFLHHFAKGPFLRIFFVPPMAETQARHLRGILRMPSQCTLACLGTIVPCHSPTWALAVRRVLLSPPISEKVRFCGSFCFHLAETTSSSLVKHAPHAVTMHARVSRHYRALPFPNLGARCKAAHISAMQKKPFLVQVVLGFSFVATRLEKYIQFG